MLWPHLEAATRYLWPKEPKEDETLYNLLNLSLCSSACSGGGRRAFFLWEERRTKWKVVVS